MTNANLLRRLLVIAVGIWSWATASGQVMTGVRPDARATLAVQSRLAPLTPIELAVKGTYQRMFGQLIERPAIYNTGPECQAQRAKLTTTAYLRQSATTSRLLSMYTTSDGSDTARITNSIVLTPAGTIRVLVAFLRYPETVGVDALNDWTRAQAQINDDHVAFASRHGYATPIVTFSNTNVVIDSTAAGTLLQDGSALDPHSSRSVRPTLQQRGFVPDDYELVISIDTSHEPFIVPPMLLGWEDTDGDHVPEKPDETPYGRSGL